SACPPGGHASSTENVSLRDAVLIGLAQALAIVPGTSRSGATISAALFLGPRRGAAAGFSFPLALPTPARAAPVRVPALVRSGADMGPVMIGMAAAAVSGLLAIRVLLGYVRTRTYVRFSIY